MVSKNIIFKIIILMLLILIISVIAYALYIAKTNQEDKIEIEEILSEVEKEEAILTEYIVYGTHLNLKGEIKDIKAEVLNVSLVLTGAKEEEKTNLKYDINDNGISFYTSDLINAGIDLEKIDVGKHLAIIEVEYGENSKKSEIKRYAIKNNTEYENIEYYTITKENSNKKIDIKFDTHKTEKQSVNYMELEAKKAKLPKDVYDVVIDPGHGGSDNGAEAGGYKEADLTIKYAKKIKQELEKLDLKVKITRDGTEDEENFGVFTVYDEDGRVNITGASKAKYVFSIHLNSIQMANSQSGVEIYAPTRMDLRLAKVFAKNIVKYANTTYSDLETNYKKADGVYVRTFKDWEIEEGEKEAKKNGYKPYTIREYTPYLYMLRETGGIATGAYVDGRNKVYGTNKYWDSNVGVESYLLELGYINHTSNLRNLLNNEEGYVKGIIETIKTEILGIRENS